MMSSIKGLCFLAVYILYFTTDTNAQYLGGLGRGDFSTSDAFSISGYKAIPERIVFTIPPINQIVNDTFSIAIEVQYANGVRAINFNDSVFLSLRHNGSNVNNLILGQSAYRAVNGSVTFSSISITSFNDNYSFRVSATGIDSVYSSTSFNIGPNIYLGGGGGGYDSDMNIGIRLGNTWIGLSNNFLSGTNWSGGYFPSREFAYLINTGFQPSVFANDLCLIDSQSTIQVFQGVTITIRPAGVLRINGTLINNGNIVIHSDNNGSGTIGESYGQILGSNLISMHHYIPSVDRRWRFLATPLQEVTFNQLKDSIFITGDNPIANGFDNTLSNKPSVYSYNENGSGSADIGWTTLRNITDVMEVGVGYRVFIRGNRSDTNRLTGMNLTQNEVTLNYRGRLNFGDVGFHPSYTNTGVSANDGWNLLGNPYASHYNWNEQFDNGINSNIDPTIYIYNSLINSYVSYNALSNVGSLTDGIIPIATSFFIRANNADPSLTFQERFKRTNSADAVHKKSETGYAHIKITSDSINVDHLFVKLIESATNTFDKYDILKLNGGKVNIYSLGLDNVKLSADVRPCPVESDTINIGVNTASTGQLRMQIKNNIETYFIHLYDSYLNKLIALGDTLTYDFMMEKEATDSIMNKGFKLIIGQLPLSSNINTNSKAGQDKFLIYPNATNRILFVKGDLLSNESLFIAYDNVGRSFHLNAMHKSDEFEVSVEKLTSGVYNLTQVDAKGRVINLGRFVKN